jgi:capsular exopolysaccharide synthesis family protein
MLPAPPAAITSAPTFLALLRALQRCWLPATVVGLLCGALAAGAAWFLSPNPKFTARAFVEMPDDSVKIFNPAQGGGRGAGESFQRRQLAMVKSQLVLNLVLDDDKVKDLPTVKKTIEEGIKPFQWLELAIHADFNLSPDILRISMDGENDDDLLKLVNAITKAYVKESLSKESILREKRLKALKDSEKFLVTKLREKKDDLQGIAANVKGGGDKEFMLAKMAAMMIPLEVEKQELMRLHARIRELEVRVAAYRAKERGGWSSPIVLLGAAAPAAATSAETTLSWDTELAAAIDNLPAVRKELDQVERLEKQMKWHIAMSPKGAKDPKVQGLRPGLLVARNKLDKEREKARAELLVIFQTRRLADVRQERQKAQDELELLRPLKALILENVSRLEQGDQKLDADVQRAIELRKEIDQLDQKLASIRGQIDVLVMENQIQPPDIPAPEAVLYREVGKARQIAVTSLAGAGTFSVVLLGFAWGEFRRRRVNSPDEVALGLGLRLVGSLPDFSYRRRRLLPGRAAPDDAHWQSLLAASVDAVRTTLLHAEKLYGVRVIVVTSAVAGEGKTSLSCHLAASLDRAGRRTLLIDGDLRAPTAHRLFDLQRSPGFSEVLRGEVGLAEAIQPTPVGGLSFLAAGRSDALAIQALATRRLAEIIEQVRGQYDFVLIDSTPMLPVADSLLLGQHADAVILSVLRDISRLTKVYTAYQRAGMLGIPVLGAVVNGVRDDLYNSSYYYYGHEANREAEQSSANG